MVDEGLGLKGNKAILIKEKDVRQSLSLSLSLSLSVCVCVCVCVCV